MPCLWNSNCDIFKVFWQFFQNLLSMKTCKVFVSIYLNSVKLHFLWFMKVSLCKKNYLSITHFLIVLFWCNFFLKNITVMTSTEWSWKNNLRTWNVFFPASFVYSFKYVSVSAYQFSVPVLENSIYQTL